MDGSMREKFGRLVKRYSSSSRYPSTSPTLLTPLGNAGIERPASAAGLIQSGSPPNANSTALTPPSNVQEQSVPSVENVRPQVTTDTINPTLLDEEGLAGSSSPQQVASPGFQKTPWDKAIEKLKLDARNGFDFEHSGRLSTITDVLAVAKARQTECEEKSLKYLKRNGEVVVLRDVADRILTNLNNLVPTGNASLQHGPQSISVALTAFQFLLQVPSTDMETTGHLLAELEYISRVMGCCATYETLYANNELNYAQRLRDALSNLYAAILMFLLRSKRYFERSTPMRYVMEAVNPYTTMSSLLIDKVKKLEEDVEFVAGAASYELQVRQLTSQKKTSDKKGSKILQWLSEVDYERHHLHFSQIRQANTGNWLLQKKDFIHWKNSPSSSILWLHGIAGAWETILASLVIDEFEKTKPLGHALAYFYCQQGRKETQYAESILSTIVLQLCMTYPGDSLPQSVVKLYQQREGSERPHLDKSTGLMSDLICDFQQTVVVIAALDECDKDSRKKLLCALNDILKSSESSTRVFKLFVTSGDADDIVLKLQNVPNFYIREISSKIKEFAIGEVEKCISDKELLGGSVDPELKQYIIEKLIEQANGMFPWVSLQIKSICEEETEKGIKLALGQLPKGLEDSYSSIWRKIQSQSQENIRLAERTLKWIMCVNSPLKPDQIIEAISIEPMRWTENDDHNGLTAMALLDICHNLVVFDDALGVLCMAHSSVNEFLQKQFNLSEAHTEIAEVCLKFLCELRSYRDDELGCHPLRDYAVHNWAQHVRLSGDGSGTLMELQKRFLTPSPAYYEWLRLVQTREYSLKSPLFSTLPITPLWIACWFQLWDIAKHLLSGDVCCEIYNIHMQTPLYLAARHGNGEVVNLLMEKEGVDLNRKDSLGNTPLFAAASEGHEGVVKLLIDKVGVDLNDKGNSPLFAAASKGHEEVVKLLLDIEGIDLNWTDSDGDTPLLIAVTGGHEGVVKLLLTKEGVNVNSKDDAGETPLSRAAWHGHAAIVKLLLMNPGVHLNSRNKLGDTAQAVARTRGHAEVANLIEMHHR